MLPWHPIYSNRNKPFLHRAFSLVELLIAIAIFSVVSLAIYATFASGIAIARRIQNIDLAQQRILLKQESLERQLRKQLASQKVLFQGEKTKISFCSTIDNYPYRLIYYFDTPSSSLKRVADKVEDIIDEKGELDLQPHSAPVVYLTKIKEVSFSYLNLDIVKNTYQWSQEWKQEYLPLAVKFIIISQERKYESTVYLPTA